MCSSDLGINPHTLQLQPTDGTLMRPEHMHHALRQFAGIDQHPLSLKFPLGVAVEQQLQGLWG